MKFKTPVVDYRKLRLSNLTSERFRHLLLLLFWPVYGLMFLFVERFYSVNFYYPMHCILDDYIPFMEIFLIPYLFWFVFLVGIHIYTLLYDLETFRKMMYFIIATYSVAILTYLLFPTCQNLRPETFARDNILTRFMAHFYEFDTNTNVCPSIHVIGSFAVMFAGLHCKGLQHTAWKAFFIITTILISLSTVFLKQHSVLDILAALIVCAIAYPICFRSSDAKVNQTKSKLEIPS